jgi:hypothetical protein
MHSRNPPGFRTSEHTVGSTPHPNSFLFVGWVPSCERLAAASHMVSWTHCLHASDNSVDQAETPRRTGNCRWVGCKYGGDKGGQISARGTSAMQVTKPCLTRTLPPEASVRMHLAKRESLPNRHNSYQGTRFQQTLFVMDIRRLPGHHLITQRGWYTRFQMLIGLMSTGDHHAHQGSSCIPHPGQPKHWCPRSSPPPARGSGNAFCPCRNSWPTVAVHEPWCSGRHRWPDGKRPARPKPYHLAP